MIGKLSTIENARVNVVPDGWAGHEGLRRLSDSDVAAMLDAAFNFCTVRSGKPADAVLALVRKADVWANSTLRYAIAKEIRRELQADPKVRDLYSMGSVMEDQARLTSDIDMVLHVESDKEDFEAWLALLDEGLVKLFRERFGLGEGFRTLIDCHVVTDEEVSRKAGYGSLLTSAHAQLTRIS